MFPVKRIFGTSILASSVIIFLFLMALNILPSNYDFVKRVNARELCENTSLFAVNSVH